MAIDNQRPPPLKNVSNPDEGTAAMANAPAAPLSANKEVLRKGGYFLSGSIVVLALLMVPMVKLFIIPLIVAATLVTICYPMYLRLRKLLWNNKSLGALSACLIIIIGTLIPAYAAGYILTSKGIQFYSIAEPTIRDILEKGDDGIIGTISQSKHMQWMHKVKIDWNAVIKESITAATGAVTVIVNKTSAGLFSFIFSLVIMLFTMYFLFVDGTAFVRRLNYLIPLRKEYKERLFNRFLQTSRGTVTAVLVIGVVQGALGALTLLVFGIKTWLVWWVIMTLLSMIPLVGSGFVLVPTGIIQILTGNIVNGICIILISLLVISNVDNFLRPYIVGQHAKMHILVVFFATIGGLFAFGIMGVIVGPVIAAMFVTLIDIYGDEFKDYLESW